jgi:hypothetical protein
VQVSFGKKITDFRLIIEVVDCGALAEMTFTRSLMHGLILTMRLKEFATRSFPKFMGYIIIF